MDQKIKLIVKKEDDLLEQELNKLNIELNLLELLETKDVKDITVNIEKRKPACTADFKMTLD